MKLHGTELFESSEDPKECLRTCTAFVVASTYMEACRLTYLQQAPTVASAPYSAG